MLRFGYISGVDAVKGLARVKFSDDKIVSDWLPVSVRKSSNGSESFPFDVNEHVWCMMDERSENGVIGGAIYSTAEQPAGGNKDKRREVFSDGTIFEYDRSAHTYTLTNGTVIYSISRTDGITIKKGGESLKKLISDLIDEINKITVTTYAGPSGTPINATLLTAIKTRLGDLFKE